MKNISFRQTRFKEEGVEHVQHKTKKFTWGFSGKKVTKRSAERPVKRPNMDYEHYHQQPPPAPPSYRVVPPPQEAANTTVKYEYSNEPKREHRPSNRSASSNRVSERHMRKKGPRSLDRMTPITEVSHDELNTAYRESEHMPELDVISEYEDNYPPRHSSILGRSQTEAILSSTKYDFDEDDISPMDESTPEQEQGEESYMAQPDIRVNPPSMLVASIRRLEVKSPLQKLEGALLDGPEKKLQDFKANLVKDSAKGAEMEMARTHEVVSKLRESHEQMKKDFYAITNKRDIQAKQSLFDHDKEAEETDDEDDLVSICSSIDLDEEPTVHEAKIMTFTRIPPGTVKLVDIPPRRKQSVQPAVPGRTEVSEPVSTVGQRHENISPVLQRPSKDEVCIRKPLMPKSTDIA